MASEKKPRTKFELASVQLEYGKVEACRVERSYLRKVQASISLSSKDLAEGNVWMLLFQEMEQGQKEQGH